MKSIFRNWLFVIIIAAILGLAWDTLEISTPWLLSRFVTAAIVLILSASLAADAILGLWDLRQPASRVAKILLICCLAPIAFIVPFLVFGTSAKAHLHFFAMKERYEEAVSPFLSLPINPGGEFVVPSEQFPNKVLGHNVYVAKRGSATDIMFVIAGMGGECTGYIFSSDGAPPFEGAASRICGGKGGAWYYGHNWQPHPEGAD